MPKVAVVIPCHNHAGFVTAAIKSVANQSYQDKSIWVIDDGSSDGSYDVISDILEIHDQVIDSLVGKFHGVPVTVMRNEQPTGPSAARNKLLNAIGDSADIIGVLDADDQYLDGKIERSVEKIKEDPSRVGLVYTDVLIRNIEQDTYTYESRRAFDRFILERENIISNAPLINRLALEKVGIYDEQLRTCEDYDLWLRITEHFVAVHIPQPLQIYTVTGDNATFSVNNERWQRDFYIVRQKLQQRNASK